MAKQNRDIPGNAMASAQAVTNVLLRHSQSMARFEGIVSRLEERGVWLTGMSIRFPDGNRMEYLVVLRCDGEGGKHVAFHNAETLLEAVSGLVARLENETLKWKEDQYG